MATTRATQYAVGNIPPEVTWTIVKGDTASFRVYVTDDALQPLNISDYTITMDIKRAGESEVEPPVITLYPTEYIVDPPEPGKFTVSLTSAESNQLLTGDIFDIQLNTADNEVVWTVATGSMIVIEDVTTNA